MTGEGGSFVSRGCSHRKLQTPSEIAGPSKKKLILFFIKFVMPLKINIYTKHSYVCYWGMGVKAGLTH
jgi:hypothetical protein